MIIGIDQNKRIVGLEEPEKIRQKLQKILTEKIIPTAPISSQVIVYKKKNIILISVWEGAKKPYQHKGKIYNREININKLSTQDTLKNLIAERKEADFQWERQPVLGTTFDDLDIPEVLKTYELQKNITTKLLKI